MYDLKLIPFLDFCKRNNIIKDSKVDSSKENTYFLIKHNNCLYYAKECQLVFETKIRNDTFNTVENRLIVDLDHVETK